MSAALCEGREGRAKMCRAVGSLKVLDEDVEAEASRKDSSLEIIVAPSVGVLVSAQSEQAMSRKT